MSCTKWFEEVGRFDGNEGLQNFQTFRIFYYQSKKIPDERKWSTFLFTINAQHSRNSRQQRAERLALVAGVFYTVAGFTFFVTTSRDQMKIWMCELSEVGGVEYLYRHRPLHTMFRFLLITILHFRAYLGTIYRIHRIQPHFPSNACNSDSLVLCPLQRKTVSPVRLLSKVDSRLLSMFGLCYSNAWLCLITHLIISLCVVKIITTINFFLYLAIPRSL